VGPNADVLVALVTEKSAPEFLRVLATSAKLTAFGVGSVLGVLVVLADELMAAVR
jgi:hypothetical protein